MGGSFLADSAAASYDVVIVDSTDPIGPGLGLFTPEFYRAGWHVPYVTAG